MQVRLGVGIFIKIDGEVIDDFQAMPLGDIEQIPALNGTNGVSFGLGIFLPRL
jgi:hypothetical protein